MVQFSLTPAQAVNLREALKAYITELRSEVTHTENFEYRQELKQSEASLRHVLTSLESSGSAAD